MNSLIRSSLFALFCLASLPAVSQELENIGVSTASGLRLEQFIFSDSTIIDIPGEIPVFSFELNGRYHRSDDVSTVLTGTRFIMNYEESLRVTFTSFGGGHPEWSGEITFENLGFDTIEIGNVLPFGEDEGRVYITGKGPWDLARAYLHRPGHRPLRVILPDNAWELGYGSLDLGPQVSVCALARRNSTNGGQRQRYSTLLPPRSTVVYKLYGDHYSGPWQEGIRVMFHDRYLYDLYEFDESLYEREDLRWIRDSYLIALQFAWDREFYDRFTGKYNYGNFLRSSIEQFGYLDVFGIWPTWPRLGVDSRNQWDMYYDLPGGIEQLRSFARLSRGYGTKFFIAYNPWDQSTRNENHYSGMARLIEQIEADGVVLDTRGSSSYELQAAADSVRKGVVMFSEGMAVTRDMPGIVSGRVHNALFLAPELNLNRIIKPEFSIFRVLDVGEAILHREIAIAFLNGHGSELNLFRPGRDLQVEEDYDLLSKTTRILRENNSAFHDPEWIPLIEIAGSDILVNRWKSGEKTIFTVYCDEPGGVNDPLLPVEPAKGYHYYSIWNNRELVPEGAGNSWKVNIETSPYPSEYTGTRKEGSIDCIARYPELLRVELRGDSLAISSVEQGSIRIWKDEPSYQGSYREFTFRDSTISSRDLFGEYQGRLVIQLVSDGEVLDTRAVRRSGGKPWLISRIARTPSEKKVPREMVLVPGASFSLKVSGNEDFILYHETGESRTVKVDTFLVDRYPVTNEEYYRFIMASGYYPLDTTNYLSSWVNGIFRQGQEKYPVVNVSLDDAKAYAEWAGKRLPTELEWQLAAQGTDGRLWPWGDEFHGTKCNNAFERATPVDAFPKGQSPCGAFDMVGNVWQMTNDIYDNGSNYYQVIRGGSHFKPTSSWWYVQGGPQPLDKTQMLLLVSPGFDRSSTVGFRCVRDY